VSETLNCLVNGYPLDERSVKNGPFLLGNEVKKFIHSPQFPDLKQFSPKNRDFSSSSSALLRR